MPDVGAGAVQDGIAQVALAHVARQFAQGSSAGLLLDTLPPRLAAIGSFGWRTGAKLVARLLEILLALDFR